LESFWHGPDLFVASMVTPHLKKTDRCQGSMSERFRWCKRPAEASKRYPGCSSKESWGRSWILGATRAKTGASSWAEKHLQTISIYFDRSLQLINRSLTEHKRINWEIWPNQGTNQRLEIQRLWDSNVYVKIVEDIIIQIYTERELDFKWF
jgi:hypothetical protein